MKKLIIQLLAMTLLLTGSAYAWGGVPAGAEDLWDSSKKDNTQIAAQHILVQDAADAVMIKKELDKGGDFSYYAQKYSICPSGKNGGFLGYFGRGQMVPEFEKKAFSMEVGEISNPVRTNFGWHIIKIVDKR